MIDNTIVIKIEKKGKNNGYNDFSFWTPPYSKIYPFWTQRADDSSFVIGTQSILHHLKNARFALAHLGETSHHQMKWEEFHRIIGRYYGQSGNLQHQDILSFGNGYQVYFHNLYKFSRLAQDCIAIKSNDHVKTPFGTMKNALTPPLPGYQNLMTTPAPQLERLQAPIPLTGGPIEPLSFWNGPLNEKVYPFMKQVPYLHKYPYYHTNSEKIESIQELCEHLPPSSTHQMKSLCTEILTIQLSNNMDHAVLIMGNLVTKENILFHDHSECFGGDPKRFYRRMAMCFFGHRNELVHPGSGRLRGKSWGQLKAFIETFYPVDVYFQKTRGKLNGAENGVEMVDILGFIDSAMLHSLYLAKKFPNVLELNDEKLFSSSYVVWNECVWLKRK